MLTGNSIWLSADQAGLGWFNKNFKFLAVQLV